MTATIKLNQKTINTFSVSKLEQFVNSDDFEDLVLGYQMIKWETWNIQSFNSFKEELWL